MSRSIALKAGLAAAFLAAATFVGAGMMGAAVAEGSAEGVIKYRKAQMKALGGHMGAIAGIAKGEVTFTEDLAGHAHAINEIAKTLAKSFPEGTGPDAGDTAALATIWEQPDDFTAAIKALEDESAKLIEVAGGGDPAATGAQVGALGKNGCGTCHETFRKKK